MRIKQKPIHIKQIVGVLVVIILILAALAFGYVQGLSQGSQKTKNIIVQGVTNPQKNESSVSFDQFWEVWNLLKTKYVTKNATEDNQKLLFGAIDGLTNSLKDPYTTFFPPEEAKNFSDEISGQFGGIGAEIGLDKQARLIVIAPLQDTPAQRAGLKAGDRIVQIDNQDTIGLSSEEAVKRIRGERGTKVVLTIIHDEKEGEKKVEITRDIIQVPTLEFKLINTEGKEDMRGSIAYIKLDNFYEKAPVLFQQAAVKTLLLGAKGILLDLRNNPGGYLDGAQSIAGWFLPKNYPVVTEEFKDPSLTQKLTSPGPGSLGDKKIVVLINKGSASASEILTGALQDHKKATIVGEKSFGKGTVQEVIPLREGMLKVTIAHWLTPNGNLIDKNGIQPDITFTEPASSTPIGIDPWMDEALKILTEKMK